MNKKDFIPIVLVLSAVVIATIIGSVYYYVEHKSIKALNQPSLQNHNQQSIKQNNQQSQQNSDETANWKVYKNTQHGYEINYPSTVTVALGGGEENTPLFEPISPAYNWYASTCVSLSDSSKSWYISLSAESQFSLGGPCGATGVSGSPANNTLRVNDKQITASGFADDKNVGFFKFSLNDRVSIEYGFYEQSAQEYSANLSLIHEILSTLKLIPGFVPSAPLPLPGKG